MAKCPFRVETNSTLLFKISKTLCYLSKNIYIYISKTLCDLNTLAILPFIKHNQLQNSYHGITFQGLNS